MLNHFTLIIDDEQLAKKMAFERALGFDRLWPVSMFLFGSSTIASAVAIPLGVPSGILVEFAYYFFWIILWRFLMKLSPEYKIYTPYITTVILISRGIIFDYS